MINLPLSDRERMIAQLQVWGEIPHREVVRTKEENEHYKRHEPLWKPWEVEDGQS